MNLDSSRFSPLTISQYRRTPKVINIIIMMAHCYIENTPVGKVVYNSFFLPRKVHFRGMDMEKESTIEVDSFIKELISSESMDQTKTIEILQLVQQKYGYISREIVTSISRHLRKPEIEIMGIATFYEQFRFNKPGDHTIKVCEGTACHVKGGAAIGQVLERELGIGPGETTDDGIFGLDRVACLGCCALAPVIVVDENAYGYCTPANIRDILNSYREED